MAKLKLLKRIIVRDRNGRIKYDSGQVPSNSFVIAFLEHIYGDFINANVSIEDVGNISRSIEEVSAGGYSRFKINATDNNDDYGIVVGTGTTAETNTDYALATQIAHGTGAGQLDYGAHSFTAPAVVGSNVDFVVSRAFQNSSGASITVKEIGIYCTSYPGPVDSYSMLCIARDVLSTLAVVANGETLTIQYTFRTTV